MEARRCPACGRRTRAGLPAGVPHRPFGPRLTAVAIQSQRAVEGWRNWSPPQADLSSGSGTAREISTGRRCGAGFCRCRRGWDAWCGGAKRARIARWPPCAFRWMGGGPSASGGWTFARVEGVEPTNNLAERALRPAVLWRKGSFGSDSEAGSRFAERLLTTAVTRRQQGRRLLTFLVEAGEATLRRMPAPSFLAAPQGG